MILPYWVWGGIISALTVLMLAWSFSVAFRKERRPGF